VAHLIDALIWVQSDEREAERRVHARIGKPNEAPTLWHHHEWMAEEKPFNTAQRTWERADVIVCGTPQIPCDLASRSFTAWNRRPARDRHRGRALVRLRAYDCANDLRLADVAGDVAACRLR
jgi:hypothetical protein